MTLALLALLKLRLRTHPLLPLVLLVVGLGVLPLEARVLVPVSGMIVGNSLKVVVVAAARLVDGVRDRFGLPSARTGGSRAR